MCREVITHVTGSALSPPITEACVIIPMYNEAATISSVVSGLRRRFAHVVCVDDGSRDQSGAQARLAGATVVRHPVNLGQGAALQTGIDFALGMDGVEHFITFDADGQHQAADAEAMLACARRSGVDVLLGSRFLAARPHDMPLVRRVVLRLAVRFTNLTTGLTLTDTHNGLRILHRRAAADLRVELSGMAHASEILTRISRTRLTVEEHAVEVLYTDYSRAKGQSSVNAVNILFDLFINRLRHAR
jgi:glycosyltransferase involved in cell wall biosynthesis